MSNNGNLPAYPEHHVFEDCGIDGNSGPHLVQTVKSGFTKREQFAMAAMQGLLAKYGTHSDFASDSVLCADALLAELERTK